jgi:hypothetical protein
MRRQKQRSAFTIYRDPRGDGWVLTHSSADVETHRAALTFYTVGTHENKVETQNVPIRRVDATLRARCGAKLAAYEGTYPEPETRFEDQPRAVKRQQHAYDIYQALGHVRGLSETLCVRAAEEFGSTWADKSADDWEARVRGIGAGRASNIADALDR